jgi:polysaccharide deacetylase family protein (PEP-CTERM system associated)
MSVDVEDYFHASAFDRIVARPTWSTRESRVERNTQRLLETFDTAGIHATFFILGWVAERFPQLVRDIAAAGHEVASHGFHHQLIYGLTPDQFRDDVRRAKQTIEDAAGCAVRGYRAPSFSIVQASLWALDVLIEEGHLYDASIFPIRHDRYGIADAPRQVHRIERSSGSIIEVPGSTVRCCGVNLPIAGGGYFRLLPYQWTRSRMAKLNRAGEPAVFYIHPWEIDPQQPRLPVGRLTRVRHYHGLAQTLDRLQTLCQDFKFDTVASVLAAQVNACAPVAARWAHAK